jgi:hypothetical protein
MIFHELLVVVCVATGTGHCEDVIINAKPPWIDRQSCEAVGKSITETLGGTAWAFVAVLVSFVLGGRSPHQSIT